MCATGGLLALLGALATLRRAGRALRFASSMQGAAQGSRLLPRPARGAKSSRDIAKDDQRHRQGLVGVSEKDARQAMLEHK